MCACGHNAYAHDDYDGDTHECHYCECWQFIERDPLAQLAFERKGYGVNKPGAWSRLYGGVGRGYFRDFGWRAGFLGGGE